MAEVRPRRHRLLSAPQPPIRGDDRGNARDDARRLVGDEREGPRGDAQRVHHIEIAMSALAKQREGLIGNDASRREVAAEGVQLRGRGKIAVPQQPRRFLERGMFRQIVDPVPRDDELAAFAVDETQLRGRRDHSIQSTAGHMRQRSAHV